MKINIADLDKAKVFAALYNTAVPLGMGYIHYKPEPMTIEEAQSMLNERQCFDYVKGRVMKIDLSEDDIDTNGYDRDNKQGTAALVINTIRAGWEPDNEITRDIHKKNLQKSVSMAQKSMEQPTQIIETKEYCEVRLGLDSQIKPYIEKAIKDSK